jgi:plastocyanin
VDHNFSVTSQHVNVDVAANTDKTATVTIPRSGVVSFFCEYHHSRGMAGQLKAG